MTQKEQHGLPLHSFKESDTTSGLAVLETALNCITHGDVFCGMSSLLWDLNEYRKTIDENGWRRFCLETCSRHAVRSMIHQSPFSRRAFEKPRGYAGDAETLDYIYEYSNLNGTSRLGHDIY